MMAENMIDPVRQEVLALDDERLEATRKHLEQWRDSRGVPD